MKFIPLLLCALLLAQPACAFEKLFSKHCKGTKVPAELALAVARHESGMKPLCLNVEGKDYFPDTREEAEKIIRKAHAAGKSYDVGLMQINSQWVKLWKIDPVCLLEPDTNIKMGVRLLGDEIDRHGLNWRAIGGYHSPNVLRGRIYAGMVIRQLKGNANLKSKLANPRLLGSFSLANPRLNGNLGDIKYRYKRFNAARLKQIVVPGKHQALRKPIGVGM